MALSIAWVPHGRCSPPEELTQQPLRGDRHSVKVADVPGERKQLPGLRAKLHFVSLPSGPGSGWHRPASLWAAVFSNWHGVSGQGRLFSQESPVTGRDI